MNKTVAASFVVGLAATAAAGCASTEPAQPASAPQPPAAPPEISVPAFSDDGGVSCAKVSGLGACVPWSQPQPENLSWPQIVAARDQQVSGVPVGPAYLCGLVRDPDLHQLAGPEAVRVLDGHTCVLASSDGPGWVSAEQGQVQGRVEFGRQAVHTPNASIAGRPATVEAPADAADRTHRSGLITASDGTPVRVSLDVTAPPAAPDRAPWRPDPARANAQWTALAQHVAAATG